MPKSIIYCHYAEENEIFYIAKLVSFVAILVMPFVYLGLIYCVASILWPMVNIVAIILVGSVTYGDRDRILHAYAVALPWQQFDNIVEALYKI